MKKAILVFLTLIAFVSCNKSQVEVDFDRPSKTPAGSSAPNPTIVVSNVDVVSNQLVITGTKLDTATSVRVTGPSGFDETFAIESQSDSSLVANSLSNLAIITNGLFDLIISNAYGAATYSITFDLQDGQVTAAKLNDMGASAGDVLTFDGSNWGPAPLTGLTYQGTFDANSVADQTTTGAAAGHYYIVTNAGSRDPDGALNGNNFSIGDWAVYNGATSQWDKVVGTNDVASVAGKTGVVTLSWADFAKTGSLLSDIANVDVTGRADGDILVWDNAGSEWVVQAPVDTNSNASTLCTGSNVLLGDGSCVALPVDTDTNTNAATICSAGEYLDGDGTCKTAATTTLEVDDITSGAGLYFTYEPDGTGCTAGQVLVWNTINTRWECGNKTVDTDTNTNAGTICSAGEYLDGDGTCKSIPVDTDTDTTYSAGSGMNLSGTTFSIPAQGVTNTMINGVTANCSSGEVLKANGTGGFSCQADNTGVPSSDATTLRGENLDTNLATDTTTDGQILVWSQTNSQWEVAPAPTDNDTTYAAGTGLTLTTGTFDVDVGTSANKIPQLDGSADLIIDGSYQLSNDLFVRWGNSYITGHSGNNNMRFYTNGTERMRLQGERLGIGNDSPQGILHVS
ncbi:MAG: hypothetical protein NXH75_04285, partial [Halobacteriovoraceae bacterium]|nr:hypothetical protein [Halobacteriovoraceae bacterium]